MYYVLCKQQLPIAACTHTWLLSFLFQPPVGPLCVFAAAHGPCGVRCSTQFAAFRLLFQITGIDRGLVGTMSAGLRELRAT
jgi:hypothetical protein